MPGMHQRFVVVEGAVRSLDRQVQTGFTDLGKLVNDGFVAVTNANRERDSKLAAAYVAMAASLGSVPANNFISTTKKGPVEEEEEMSPSPAAAQACDHRTSLGPASQHRLALKHFTLHGVYDEWYGLGRFLDKPVLGGIAALESVYKASWRRHFKGPEVKHFSRLKICIAGITNLQQRSGKDVTSVLDDLNEVYVVEAKFSVSKMAKKFQDMGLVDTKKARGKPKSAIADV
jgi:hypothetical protein